MDDATTTPAPKASLNSRRGKLFIPLAAAVLCTGLAVYWFVPRPTPPDKTKPQLLEIPPDPRDVFQTKYENVRSNVAYVDDAKCATCHTDHAKSFAHHSMGKSFGTFQSMPQIENYSQPQIFSPPGGNYQYEIKLTDKGVNHIERRLDNEGKVIYEEEWPVAYVFGSGGRGRSYLIQRGDALYQSPISWYSQKGLWDLSPGYERGPQHMHFQRPIVAECLLCHTNRFDHVPDSVNRYQGEIFHGLSIGCQRCHGPGELHVKYREGPGPHDGPDYTIVNPAHLKPHLREAVCQQCHLHGKAEVDRIGRHRADFRPGLPLDAFVTYFEEPGDPMDQAVGQVEQMHASICYKKSLEKNKLGCISCHDPHALPAREEKIAYYREKCQSCHGAKTAPCKVSEPRRQKENGNSCYACHMPRYGAADIVHTSMSDHRIPLRPGGGKKQPLKVYIEKPLVPFHEAISASTDAELTRDTGIAISRILGVDPRLPGVGLRMLQTPGAKFPADRDALYAEAVCLVSLNQRYEALQKVSEVLELAPNSETALRFGAFLEFQMNKPDAAIALAERQAALSPTQSTIFESLAKMYYFQGKYELAAARAQKTIELMPTSIEARVLLVKSLQTLGKTEEAEVEFALLKRLNPPQIDELRRWLNLKKN